MTRTHRTAPVRLARSTASLGRRLHQRLGGAHGEHEDGGFTLVEALVSLTIFVIVAAAAALAIVTGISGNNASSDRVGAAQVAQQESDRARAMSKDVLTATPVATSTATRGSKQYTVQRTVSYIGGTSCPTALPTGTATATPREIRVNVVVTVPGSGRTVTMDTVLAC
jgi:prepilin-type N-terminal cleavage/methylation domain-containing protein